MIHSNNLDGTKNSMTKSRRIVLGFFIVFAHLLLTVSSLANNLQSKVPWNFKRIGIVEAWKLGGDHGQGTGIRILDLGSGVDIKISGIKNKVEKGMFLGTYVRAPEDSDPFHDQRGHGTGIVGAMVGDLTPQSAGGVAPRAKILVGKLPNADNKVDAINNLIRGIRWGISEKVDIINLSLVYSENNEPGVVQAFLDLKLALHDAYEMGIAIIAGSGNGGNGELDFIARQPEVLSVGAVDSDFIRAPFSQYGPELGLMAPAGPALFYYPQGCGRSSKVILRNSNGVIFEPASMGYVRSPITNVHGQLQYVGYGDEKGFARFTPGNIAVVQQVIGAIANIADQAVKSGARGLIFINYTRRLSTKYTSLADPEAKIPIVFVNKPQGEIIKNQLLLGQNIRARLKTKSSDFAIFFGTSGSAPIVSGVVALMKAVNKNLRAQDIYKILRETATPIHSSDNEYGSGVVNAAAAIRAALKY